MAAGRSKWSLWSVFVLLWALPSCTFAFPEYQNPITTQPPLSRPKETPCIVSIFEKESLNGYYQVAKSTYNPPGECKYPWKKVILEFRGAAKGVQFDRYGALWIGGVEVLRTTTPEPDNRGIHWYIEKDLTQYSKHLDSSNLTAALSIPNVVTSTYTSPLNISVRLAFYSFGENDQKPAQKPYVIPLKNPTIGSAYPWDIIGVTNNETYSHRFSLGIQNGIRAYIDLYASAHACEEFWYSNPPTPYAKKLSGLCGGGPHRSLEVRIDRVVAGIANPFPVIYTGGVCPILWRPLTGILSFDIVPYRIDISPFLGVLNNGKDHLLEVRVRGGWDTTPLDPEVETGVWYLDPVLLVYADPAATRVKGDLPTISDTGSQIDSWVKNVSKTEMIFSSASYRIFSAATTLTRLFSGRERANTDQKKMHFKTISKTRIHSRNLNRIVDDGNLTETVGSLLQTSESKGFGGQDGVIRSEDVYPYAVRSDNQEAYGTFDITGNVTYTRFKSVAYTPTKEESIRISWANGIEANARYNRSISNHSDIRYEYGEGMENYNISISSRDNENKLCYNSSMGSFDGFVQTNNTTPVTCGKRLPEWLRLCGYEMCAEEGMLLSAAHGPQTVIRHRHWYGADGCGVRVAGSERCA